MDSQYETKKNDPNAIMPYPESNDEHVGEVRGLGGGIMDKEPEAQEGHAKFHRLGWKRLTVVLIVEAIALGSLSLPGAFATLGMVPGVILSVGMGLICIYTAHVIGQTKLKHPEIAHYADVGRVMFGRWGYEIISFMFVLQLIFIVGSHVLTGTIMWGTITDNGNGTCSLVFGIVSAIILFLLAIPPSFAEVAILGYIDFVSICAAILITMIATGIRSSHQEGGLAAVPWSCWPKEDLSLAEGFIAVSNIVFAYSFAMCQFSFMDEMHTPSDYKKSIVALGLIEIFIYTVTGGVVYAFVGPEVQSPALLSAGPLLAKVAFGIALPVIFISGSINTVVVSRYLIERIWPNNVIRYVNTPAGWMVWLGFDFGITLIAWVIAEAIPFFSDLLAICSALFISGFSFYFPALMYFKITRNDAKSQSKKYFLDALNVVCFVIGMGILGIGTYAAIQDIMDRYDHGKVSKPYSCAPLA
ncbi:N amino acid transport system protein [Neurospora tetrasperma FGSC 2508]|uniref:N amino acid transport system protein n=1 Tax=Neurospora tetrasperma (strain FGSC 2508 / ATCC MYA-4615 / P0657) TaxID=510951 RepID=F8MIG2_NEUT8|nr:N amino acid transport system protein [Neurospora tetrasperma FGSC 2508]EGO58966.1 N amino acid transport system protein [Neurospora tetrasperma FGSC 2508]EGZ73066.1 N amino acid transport system protein [Neurospora tetrasperma FGSC 2509]